MQSLSMIEDWPVPNAAAAVVRADGAVLGEHGPQQHLFPLASVTKLLTAYATLVAVEEGVFDLDDPAGPEGSTVRHLLAHTSGLAFDEHKVMAAPGNRRLYSNAGFDVLAAALAEASGIEFGRYAAEAVFEPLGMRSTLINTAHRSPAGAGGLSTVADLALFAAELQAPKLLDPSTVAAATREVAFPGTSGVLPGFGHRRPNDWGLGFEIRGEKAPHWTGTANSPATFGHFGQSGTFLWVDPVAGIACIALTDRDFGPWAAEVWPQLSDAILSETR
ncbi:serine hydrolase domain-containing protein [Kitasatospora paracochleata]|uniref:CubicO group peptidase (Beta-lactamase class C family) n=1 Tax=Kitasatospora paracochleata TaxID=58354 RepID=A0ABT1IZD2_9ACTN|nr:serine hydrolase domain-containing protein [Kitasatospora paracochleata]MCP2310522.1 CubicO group peptidase (beta-lactamase class C family) [Kitasatospora paracochleata]